MDTIYTAIMISEKEATPLKSFNFPEEAQTYIQDIHPEPPIKIQILEIPLPYKTTLHTPIGGYIGCKASGIVHIPQCDSVDRMNEDNKIFVDTIEGFDPCGWCKAGLEDSIYAEIVEQRKKLKKEKKIEPLATEINEQICSDPNIRTLFKKSGCIQCNEKLGDVRMYPHPDGMKIPGKKGTWWVYFNCYNCKYQTSYYKAENHLKKMEKAKINERKHAPVQVL